jgi:diaminohydroxyphosphoribosylaminopyrimidine deaminase/5-amino-6-(5-phosphoribosylamino)uracil reductase
MPHNPHQLLHQPSHQTSHHEWMAKALQLAHHGFYSTAPNPRVGCLVVYQNICVAQGWHEYPGGPHAEINAIRSKTTHGQVTDGETIEPGSCFYITLEPCSHQGKTPPCVDALIELKPSCVVIAMQDPNPLIAGKGIAKLKEAGIEVICGVLEAQARQLNAGFISRMEKKRPYLRVKMATSLDGRTALSNGVSQWISGEPARLDVQRLRARSSAILTTARTVQDDNPSMNVRLSSADLGQTVEVRQPIKVIIDSRLCLTGNEAIFAIAGDVWVITTNTDQKAHEPLLRAGAEIIVLDRAQKDEQVDLSQLMQYLASREINEIHTECGQRLAGALMQLQLVDEVVLYLAPCFLGNQAQGLFDLGEITQMKDRVNCHINDVRTIGNDIRLTLTPEYL